MRKLNILLSIICLLLFRGMSSTNFPKPDSGHSMPVIDSQDTVIFDILSATYTPTYVEFPVKIKTDEEVYALDFEFKFNLQKFTFDSTYNNFSSLSSTTFYNPNDSTLRLTSYSLQSIPNDSTLIVIRFSLLTSGIIFDSTDIYDIEVLLNGTLCSYSLMALPPLWINEMSKNFNFDIYPNPSQGNFNIHLFAENNDHVFELYDMTGKLIYNLELPKCNSECFIALPLNILPGIYNCMIRNGAYYGSRKLTVVKE